MKLLIALLPVALLTSCVTPKQTDVFIEPYTKHYIAMGEDGKDVNCYPLEKPYIVEPSVGWFYE